MAEQRVAGTETRILLLTLSKILGHGASIVGDVVDSRASSEMQTNAAVLLGSIATLITASTGNCSRLQPKISREASEPLESTEMNQNTPKVASLGDRPET